MLLLYILIAVFIGWIWIDYYRLIEVYDHQKVIYFLVTFILGGLGVFVVYGSEKMFGGISFRLNGNYINDFFYCIFRIGAVEEIAKLIPFTLVCFLFPKQFNEPIDYLTFICVSALGFSAVENTLYFYNDGPTLILDRAILAAVGHMFDTSLIAYGIILTKFRKPKNKFFTLTGFFLLAAVSHGFYDFWLLIHIKYGVFITILYFLVTIEIFARILNNALNTSSFFTYKKFIDSDKVTRRMLLYYGIVFITEFILLAYSKNVEYAAVFMRIKVFTVGFIVIIAVLRLSRFKLIKDRWESVRIELPFAISFGGDNGFISTGMSINVKGDPFSDAVINTYFEEYFYLFPVSSRNGIIKEYQKAYIEKKLFLENDDSYYVARLFLDDFNLNYNTVLLKAKTYDTTLMYNKYPIVAILQPKTFRDFDNPKLNSKDFEFQEWTYIKPLEKY